MKPKIEKVIKANEREIIQFLAIATLNDAPNILVFPDYVKRIFNTTKITSTFTRILGIFDERYFIRDGNEIAAVAMWIPPGKQITNNHLIQFGFLGIPFIMGFRVFKLLMRFLDISTKIREDQMKNRNHWYLFYLVTNPNIKSQNYANILLSHLLTKSESQNEPVFAHCFEKEKFNLLKKKGFNLVSTIRFSEDCIMNCLIKESKSPGKRKK